MSIIEQIKNEIKRRITDNTFGAKLELIDILAWLDTLESEKPMGQDGLGEEIQRFLSNATRMDKGKWKGKYPISEMGFGVVARHFAEWGAEHLADARKMIEPEKKEGRTDCSPQGEVPNGSLATQSYENIPKDLEEAADEYEKKHTYQRYDGGGFTQEYDATLAEAVIFGAKWQAEQDKETIELAEEHAYLAGAVNEREKMMKEAVEADVNIYRDLAAGKSWAEFVVEMPTNNLGDKVRIIIVKEDNHE